MHQQDLVFTTPANVPGWQRWLVFSPLARIVFFVVLLIGCGFGLSALVGLLGWNAKDASTTAHAFGQLVTRALPAVIAYLLLVKLLERRPLTELAPRKLVPGFLKGTVAGLLLFSAVVAVLALAGSYHVTGTNPGAQWLPALLMAGLGAGIGEEIIMRGVMFRIIEEGLGTWIALIISALLFGAAHLGNPGATLWSSAAIAIEAGLLFGMLYHVTRSLPICMGLHAAWNFAQGTMFGIPVSGHHADGWLVSTRSGPDWLSGGVFGAEASVVALTLCLLVTLALVVVAMRRGSIVPCRPWQWLLRRLGGKAATTPPDHTPQSINP